MPKLGFVSLIGNDPAKVDPRDVLRDDSKQQDIDNLGDCLRAIGDGQSLGDFSLTIVLNAPTKGELDHLVGEFAGVFSNADGNLFLETYNQLNALFATVPGDYAQNLRKLYLLNTNYADLSFLFTILAGEKRNSHLDTEYLAALETDNQTPYFLNLHNGEVPHTLILGMTGSGKTVRETEAEAVAFVVGKTIGLQTNRASADYIHLYHGNAALLTESLEVIQKTSAVILSALEKPAAEPTEEPETDMAQAS